MPKKDTTTFRTTREEIQRLCAYITSDASIAAYFGISIEEVADVRRMMPRERRRSQWEIGDPIGTNGHEAVSRSDAAAASKRLCEAMHREFLRFEALHGLRRGEGQMLLMDCGVRMPRRAA